MSSFNNEKKLYILDLKFDYFAISQYRDLHFKEINKVLKWPRHSSTLNGVKNVHIINVWILNVYELVNKFYLKVSKKTH